MKQILFVTLSVMLLSLSACKQNSTNETGSTISFIDSCVNKIQSEEVDYRYLDANDFILESDTLTIAVAYNNSDKPAIVMCFSREDPFNVKHFYLSPETGKTIYFYETYSDPTPGNYISHKFYYNGDKLIKGATIKTEMENQSEAEYLTKDNDFRVNKPMLDGIVSSIIGEVEKDKPELSPAANVVRKQGGVFWASGSEPGWSIAIYANNRVELTTNYGSSKCSFDGAIAEIVGDGIFKFTSEKDGSKFEAVITKNTCTDDADIKHPYSATVKLDNKTYNGCGATLISEM